MGPSSTEKNIYELEMAQKRAARIVTRNYRTTTSVTKMIENLQWPTLQDRRRKAKAIMLYRIVHHLVAIPSQPYLVPRGADLTRGHNIRFLLLTLGYRVMNIPFFSSTIRLWNDLPSDTVYAPCVERFKNSICSIIMT
jgi:hypothetical protein